MQKQQANNRFCSQPNHEKCEIEFICLNQTCHHFRLFCWKCLQEDKHTSHLNEIKKTIEFNDYSEQIQKQYYQFSSTLKDNLKEVQQNLEKYCLSLQQKYVITQAQFNSLNSDQVNQALQNMIKFKTSTQELESCFKSIINRVSELILNQFQELELNKLTYIEKKANYFIRKKFNSVQEYPQILLLGTAGVGKTKLVKQLTNDQNLKVNIQTQQFKSYVIDEFQFTVVDSPSFEIIVDSKDAIMQQFAQYFNNQQTLSSLVIVVNFERIDLMRRKKYKSMMSIFIVDWQLSENESQDKSLIQERFSNFKIDNIQYIRNDASSDQLKTILFDALRPIQLNISLTDSVFSSQNMSYKQKEPIV